MGMALFSSLRKHKLFQKNTVKINLCMCLPDRWRGNLVLLSKICRKSQTPH